MIPLADYYIIAGVVYQAPDLGTVISSRAVRICIMIFIIHFELCGLWCIEVVRVLLHLTLIMSI